jgi:hypothetical protein
MPVTLQLANQVLKLQRQHMVIAQMAAHTKRTEAEILEAHQMLGMSIAGEIVHQRVALPEAERAALRERWPTKWQGHYGRSDKK